MDVQLTPNHVDTFTRPEFYGTPAYMGKVEWFDVVDRATGALLRWVVSRVDGNEVIVNHPSYGVTGGLATLRSAVELIKVQREREAHAA
ncbi:hypothetical protein [Allostreptomyces psammosilenae]|uniref:Uncharacterized protein n=1 Tax=Allostreptomyces psammosilenae TaxID=1892865 RepID=A0A852ZUZ2_9ACTN|nr:hypothetical protein [Allostreptomyces psammosilenae]NYI06079.1 hypothetical protein [Allostreptomyces psammosilenae]